MIAFAGARHSGRRLFALISRALLGVVVIGAGAQAQMAPSSDSGAVVAVAARRIPRGAVLAAADIALARVVNQRLAPTAAQQPAPGWVTRRVVLPGEVLREPAVAPARLVAAGQPVRFELTHDGIRLSLDGIATSAAS